MDTRNILKIILGLIIGLVLVVGGYLSFLLLRPARQQKVERIVVSAGEEKKKINPWANEGNVAILLVKSLRVVAPVEQTPDQIAEDRKNKRKKKKAKASSSLETEEVLVEALVKRASFYKNTLNLGALKEVGWKVQWWGETKYGPSFYLVRYVFKDAHIQVGPAWLVDLKSRKVVPKNVLARAVMEPLKATKDKYYDKHKQVVSALASHRFEAGINLSGALINYFETLRESSESKDGDKILGWTIDHDRGPLFKAYFQWIEAGVPTYAEFEFDYDRKALRAVNFQAANVMREGEDFSKKARVSIMAKSFNPKAPAGRRWMTGACRNRKLLKRRARVRHQCKALATMLSQNDVVEALEWLLTAQVESSAAFTVCKDKRHCKWSAKPVNDHEFEVSYIYKLKGGNEHKVGWKIGIKDAKITPLDRRSTAAWRSIHPREG